MLKGLGISSGLALAKTLVLKKEPLSVPGHTVSDTASEINFFRKIHEQVLLENHELYETARRRLSREDAAIFLAHREILEDETSLIAPIINSIRDNGWNAAKAADRQFQQIISLFEDMEDEYMKARASDMRDIRERLLRHLLGIKAPDLSRLPENTIIVACEITPSDTAGMNLDKIAGFITEIGGFTSHSAIIARSREIPAVSQIMNAVQVFENGTLILLDGTKGTVDSDITEEKRKSFFLAKEEEKRQRALWASFKGKPTVTRDGHSLSLLANIGSPDDIDNAISSDAEGIGLFRTEFLYMNSASLPDENTQFEAYRYVLRKMAPKPVIIRTLDIGGDKELPALNLPKEDNPFLGYRAIRICLDRPDLFRIQLRALLRASIYGNLHIMFPMISALQELRRSKELLEEVKQKLLKDKIPFASSIPVGMMIEVPAAAVMADDFAKECDFFSIGTNDLTQYTLAADRGNSKISYLYDTSHPAVLHLIKNTIEAAHNNNIMCGICGEAAGDASLQPFLIQYGIDELSMSPSSILKSRMQISNLMYKAGN